MINSGFVSVGDPVIIAPGEEEYIIKGLRCLPGLASRSHEAGITIDKDKVDWAVAGHTAQLTIASIDTTAMRFVLFDQHQEREIHDQTGHDYMRP